MNCRNFENLFSDLQSGQLTSAECEAVKGHLAECAACLRLLEVAQGNIDLMPAAEAGELTLAILARTSGGSCHRTLELLCDFVDQALAEDEAELVSRHLRHCAGCSAVASQLSELRAILPAMAQIQPEGSFVAAVLAATSAGKGLPRPEHRVRLREWWGRMVRRPRFSFEVAYVGTLVLAIFLGNPFPALNALSVRALEEVTQALPGPIAQSEGTLLRSARNQMVAISECEQDIRASLDRARSWGENLIAVAIDGQIRMLRIYRHKGVESGRRLWHRWRPGSWSVSRTKKTG